MSGNASERRLDLLYMSSLFFIWVVIDFGLTIGAIPQSLPHRMYLFMVQGLLPLVFVTLLLGRDNPSNAVELFRIRTLGRYASLTMIGQALTDPAWCILLGLNPINPFGDWRYPRVPMPTYLFIALRLIPSAIVYYLSTTDGWLQRKLTDLAKEFHFTLCLERGLSFLLLVFLLMLPFIFFPA